MKGSAIHLGIPDDQEGPRRQRHAWDWGPDKTSISGLRSPNRIPFCGKLLIPGVQVPTASGLHLIMLSSTCAICIFEATPLPH